MRIIARTKSYPALLVQHGHVHFDEEDLSKTIGSVFLEKTELNLQVSPAPPAQLSVLVQLRCTNSTTVNFNISSLVLYIASLIQFMISDIRCNALTNVCAACSHWERAPAACMQRIYANVNLD